MTRYACASCGSTDLAAWYRVEERQGVTELRLEGDTLVYDYDGVTKSGEGIGPDEEFTCVACGAMADTLEELVGLPPPAKPPPAE